jgi:hypothetical protein
LLEKEDNMSFEISQTRDGAIIISTNNPPGMDGDLVFASGAMNGDTMLEKQIELAKFIVEACNAFLSQQNAPPVSTETEVDV